MSDEHVLDEIPFNPIHDLRDRQTLFAILAALFAGMVIAFDVSTSMAASPMLPAETQPGWIGDAEWAMWMSAGAAVMGAAGWISTDRARLKMEHDDD